MEGRKMKKVFWGILFLMGALALLLGKLGYLNGLGFWSVFFSVVLLGFLINGILKRSFGEILFSLAMLVVVNDELLHLEAITPWPVLGAALLGTIGLNFIFPKKRNWKNSISSHYLQGSCREEEENGEILSGEEIRYEITFGGAIKYVAGQEVSRVFLEASFGSLVVYFTDAVLRDDRAEVVVDCSFANMELYVPAGWNVVVDVSNSFGGTEEKGHGDPDGENTLWVKGDVSFGALTIHYI